MEKKILITRDSVDGADDMEAPNVAQVMIEGPYTLIDILKSIVESSYLPEIHGGRATWSVAYIEPLAVIAQQWKEPKLFPWSEYPLDDELLKIERLHFNYYAQEDPEVVFSVLRRFRLPKL
jgi:hypothetical protein